MFSSIGQIFQVQPRQAENSDTRQHIQRHDPDFERKKNKKQEEKEELFPEDGATVSVQALRIFLENFLKSLSEGKDKPQSAAQPNNQEQGRFSWDEDEPAQPAQTPRPVSGQAAHAAGAYQSMARVQQKTSLLEGGEGINEAPLIKLEASEVRTIHQILEDLKDVEAKKIEYIRIERGESFLKSIAAAVEKIKHGPSFQI